MHFSVIVETTPDKKLSVTEDSIAEFERYLLAAHISPKVLETIEPGKPHVLKNELSYEQAVDLSDRLMDFGLESEIHPPIKPDDGEDDGNDKKNPQAPEKKSTTQSTTPSTTQPAATQQKESIEKTEIKSADKTADHNKTPAAKPASVKTSTVKTSTAKTASSSAAVALNKTARANTAPTAQTQLKSPKSSHTNSSASRQSTQGLSLKQQADQVKSLFKIPKDGIEAISISKSDTLNAYTTAFLSLALPMFYVLATSLIAFASIGSAILFYQWIGSFSTILWGLSVVLICLPLLILSALLIAPFFTKTSFEENAITLSNTEEPRLFMLVAAVSKIIHADTPEKIRVDFSGEMEVAIEKENNSKKSSTTNNSDTKNSESPLTLSVCLSLLSNLSIREFSCLLARELGKYNHEELRKPLSFSQKQLARLKNLQNKPNAIGETVTESSNRVSNEKIHGFMETISNIIDTTKYIFDSFFSFSHELIANRLRNNRISQQYQSEILRADTNTPLEELASVLDNLSASRSEATLMMLEDNEHHRYAASLAALISHIEEKNTKKRTYKVLDNSVIPKDHRLAALVNKTQIYSKEITLNFYKENGIDTEKAQLLSIDNLLKKESRDAKIEKVAEEYFGKWHHGLQIWKLPKDTVLAGVEKNHMVITLNNCINKLRYLSPDRTALIEKYYRQLKQLTEVRAAKKIRSTGEEYKFTSITDNISNLDHEINAREARLKDIQTELTQQNSTMGERIALGLLLDSDHESTTSSIYSALSVLSDCAGSLNKIAADCEELQTLINHVPKKSSQHFDLQIKKVKDSIDDSCKILLRKLKKCPYDFADQRYPFLYSVLNEKLIQADSINANKRTLQKGKITLTTVATCYQAISNLAANYATRMERMYKIQSIRKVQQTR